MLRRAFLAAMIATACAGSCLAEPALLRAGWDVARSRDLLGRDQPPFACAAPVAPVVDMGGFQSRYDPKDPTQSRVDPKREASQAARNERLGAFVGALSRLGDRYVLTKPRDPAIAQCLFAQLHVWAREDALLSSAARNDEIGRHQAVMTQAWQLSTVATAYLRVADAAGDQSPGDMSDIRRWMGALAAAVVAEYTADNQWTRHGANHLYWAGAAVGYAGAALQEPRMLDFAMRALARGLDDVDPKGALRKEMERGARALIYQNFATLALAALVRLADANGVALSPGREAAFMRLVSFNAAQARDPSEAAALAKAAQVGALDRSSLAWIDLVLPRLRQRNAALSEQLESLSASTGARPAWHVYLGGDASAVFDPEGSAGTTSERPAPRSPGPAD